LCARETVPADYATPGPAKGEELNLFVRKFPAQRAAKGSVWLVAGGPGESGASFYALMPTLRRSFPDFDIIIPDHRGTGLSSRLCPAEEAPGSPGGTALAGAEWGTCFAHLNQEPQLAARFSITNAANDLALLIERAHSPQPVYVYGVSYGTQLVLRTLQLRRLKLAGVILDSLVPMQTAPEWDLSRRSFVVDAVGRRVLSQCDASEHCAAVIGEPVEAAYRRLLARAAQEPALVAEVPGKNLKRFLGGLLDVPQAATRIPYLIKDIGDGHDAELKRVVALVQAKAAALGDYPQSAPSIPLVSIISNSENNLRPGQTSDDVKREEESMLFTSSLPGLLIGSGLPWYPRDRYFGKLPGHVPRTLVLQGAMDPKTHYDAALSHVASLRQVGPGPVDVVTVASGSHFVLWSSPSCFESAARAFVGGTKGGDRTCLVVGSSH
jgi:pimeloyl-ACP methyl ester carboxylesterase